MNNLELEVLFDNRTENNIEEETYEKIEKSIESALIYEKYFKKCQVSVSIVDNEEIKDLNNQFRNIDKVTDVLSFPMDDEDYGDDEAIILGDIVLCLNQAVLQAKEYEHSVTREICYLSVHSTLHLLGFDHIDEEDKKEMREEEKQIMKEMNISR